MKVTGDIKLEELAELTREYGGDWGLDHSKRLMQMVETLAEGRAYDKDVVALAAYLHDWGGYQKWMQPKDHAERSREVAEPFLREHNVPEETAARVLECIACHHGGGADRSFESKLFTDADALDLLGVCGFARIFAMNARDIKAGHAAVIRWRDVSMNAISLDSSRKLAEQRVKETNELLKIFEEETFGVF